MGEGWLMHIVADRWFLAGAAYFLGLLTGWLVWSGGRLKDGEAPPEAARPPAERLAALEAELKTIQSLLQEDDAESEAFAEHLGELDDAVKRANGRLKLILKSVKRR